MSDEQRAEDRRAGPSESASPTWWVVFSRELRELWIGGKALHLILIYTVLLGIYSFLLASNAEVNLMPLKEMVLEMVKASIAVGLFISLIIGADSFSGERERATLENLLLTPASRRQIVVGKFLAAVSPWPAALAVAIPYWVVLSRGDAVLGKAVLWAVLLGSLLAPALAGLGILVSIWCNTNRTSMLVSICIYLLLLLPTELMAGPAKIQRSAEQWFRAELNQWVNPLAATSRFLWKVLVNDESPAGLWFWHVIPVLFTLLILLLVFVRAGPRVRLDAGAALKLKSYWDRLHRVAAMPGFWPSLREVPRETGGGLSEDVFLQPTSETHGMSVKKRASDGRATLSGSVRPTWWLVFRKELRDLWIGGKALYLTLVYTILLAIYSYVMARDSVLSMIPPQEMVYELLKAAIVASVFVGVIIGADSLSGERERATLEGILLTPTSRREIVVGKFLAAISPWLVALVIIVPYLKVLSQGDAVFGQAVVWGAVTGCLLAPAFSALGMFVSFWCSSNKTSLFVGLCLYLFFELPTQLPAHAQGGVMGLFFQWVNPLAAPRVFLASVLVNNWTLARAWTWLLSPMVFAVVVFWLLFFYAGPGLRLEAGKAKRFTRLWGRATGLALVICAGILTASSAAARGAAPLQGQTVAKSLARLPLQISIDLDAKVVRAGTPVYYTTSTTNDGTTATPPLIVAMNIVNLNAKGEIVDPEDWSPQRTQYVDSLPPGKSVTHSWRVNAILDGDYMIYMVLIPAPDGVQATSQPVASPGIHLTVTPFTRLNPGGVIPYAIGGPILVGLIIFLVHRRRRRSVDTGGA